MKRYPPQEIELLTQTINKVRLEHQAQIDKAQKNQSKQPIKPGNFPKIGL